MDIRQANTHLRTEARRGIAANEEIALAAGNVGRGTPASLRCEHSFQDPLGAEIVFAIVLELRAPTAGRKPLAETLAVRLAASLMQRHTTPSSEGESARLANRGLDRRKLTRVKEYVAANLEGDLTIAQLAKVACLSPFHFARAFKAAVGQSPYQYVSAHRLERAKELLTRGEQSLLDIAIALNFSSQANFTRAFRQRTGMSPGRYRARLHPLSAAVRQGGEWAVTTANVTWSRSGNPPTFWIIGTEE